MSCLFGVILLVSKIKKTESIQITAVTVKLYSQKWKNILINCFSLVFSLLMTFYSVQLSYQNGRGPHFSNIIEDTLHPFFIEIAEDPSHSLFIPIVVKSVRTSSGRHYKFYTAKTRTEERFFTIFYDSF